MAMQKSLSTAKALMVTSALLLGNSIAQQTSSTSSQTSVPPKKVQKTVAKPLHKTTPPAKPLVLTTQKDKQSYAIGLNLGKNLHRDLVEIDPKIFLQGLEDALNGGKVLLSDDEIRATMMALQVDVRQKQEAKRLALTESNKKEGQTFLASNATKEGVVTLPSGLQYKILKEGTGAKPAASDSVVCNYRGTLLDNTEFDSSYKRGQPATFTVNRVIKGWTEALQLMPVGSKWQLFIPAELAYGERGQGPVIGPNATLIFEVELLSIQEKPKQESANHETPKTETPKTESPTQEKPKTETPKPEAQKQ
jgi:FKBP-type peptidyl-prolyl cis-trans isomerase FklB